MSALDQGECTLRPVSLYADVTQESVDPTSGLPTFGCITLDATTSEFCIFQFADDVCRTQLETLVRHSRPKELLYEKGELSAVTLRLLKNLAPSLCVWTALKPGSEFLASADCVAGLNEIYDGNVPDTISGFYESPEAMAALGALVYYLRQLNLQELFTARNLCALGL